MKDKLITQVLLFLVLIAMQSCNDSSQSTDDDASVKKAPQFMALDLPATLANGDQFPTDSNVIGNWLSKPYVDADGRTNNKRIISHAWALWQALTQVTDQKYNGRNLLLYETWYTPQDVMAAMDSALPLEKLARSTGNIQFRKKFKFGHDTELNPAAGDISGKVKYNTVMADQALAQRYFDKTVLKSKIIKGEINSLAFKPGAVMLKPIYRVLTSTNQVAGKEDTYYFHIWGGKKDGGQPDSAFSKEIYVTTNPNNTDIDNIKTYSIADFIYHDMTEAEAYTYNHSTKEGNEFIDTAKAGDPIILLGMHVSTRETQRWTWQTFYWTEDQNNPVFPSSKIIADGRNSLDPGLEGVSAHYAVSIGYSMMSPALPYTSNGPIDIMAAGVSPVYALNPYIEGTFTPKTFPRQDEFYSKTNGYEKQLYTSNIDGITSNCMSCHSQAAYAANPSTDTLSSFLADQYVNRNAPWFRGKIQLDFAWSLFPGFEQPLKPSDDQTKN